MHKFMGRCLLRQGVACLECAPCCPCLHRPQHAAPSLRCWCCGCACWLRASGPLWRGRSWPPKGWSACALGRWRRNGRPARQPMRATVTLWARRCTTRLTALCACPCWRHPPAHRPVACPACPRKPRLRGRRCGFRTWPFTGRRRVARRCKHPAFLAPSHRQARWSLCIL